MKITKEITLDVSRLNRFQSIIAKQNDKNSRYLKVSVADEGNVLVLPSSSKVTITATRPDKSSASFLGEVSEDGKAVVPLSPWMLEIDGSLSCEVSIITEESVLKTTSFNVDVEPDESSNEGESDITQDPNYDILVELIQEVAGVAMVEKEAISTAVDAYLREKNIRPLQRGTDYWTPEDKTEIINDVKDGIPFVKTAEQPTFVDSIEEMTDTSKLYVLPDGYIWAYMYYTENEGGYKNLAEPLPDNTTDTTKWVNGYRFGSIGAPSAQSGTTISNMVSCTGGDIIRIKGVTLRENTDRVAIHKVGDGNNDYSRGYFNVGVAAGSDTPVVYNGFENGVYTFTLSNWGSYFIDGFRFAMPTPANADDVIITVNQEIKEGTEVKKRGWVNTNHAFVPNDYEGEFIAFNHSLGKLQGDITILTNTTNKLKEDIATVEEKIKDVGSVDSEIPDYWKEYLDGKIETIRNLHRQFGKDCFSFVLMADTHYPSNPGKLSPILAKKIIDEANIKYVLHAGDFQTRGCHSTKEKLLEENEILEKWFAPINDRLLLQQGNHEGAYGTLDRDGGGLSNTGKVPAERETYVHNLTPQEMHEFVYRKVGMIGNVHFDDTGTAYYIDDTSNNVRYIGLNTQCNDYELQADGTQKYPKMWIMRFSKAQFDFLIDEALTENVTNKTKIVIFGHVPLTQEIIERDVMIGLLRAFKNKTSYSGSCDGEYGYDTVSINADFTGAKGTLVGYFHGHNHLDSFRNDIGFALIGTRSDAHEENDRYNADGSTNVNGLWYKRKMSLDPTSDTYDLTNEQSFDVFTVTNDKIYATKIGAGADREISY